MKKRKMNNFIKRGAIGLALLFLFGIATVLTLLATYERDLTSLKKVENLKVVVKKSKA